MYRINQLYRTQGRSIEILAITDLTLAEVKSQLDDQTVFYISVRDDSIVYIAPYQGLRLNLLLVETAIANCITWEDIETTLTEYIVKSYNEQIPGYVNGYDTALSSMIVHHAIQELSTAEDGSSSPTWAVHYFDSRTWSTQDVPLFCHSMPDLLLEGPSTISHGDCLVSCNGHLLRSVLVPADTSHGEQLLVRGGHRYMWSSTTQEQPDILVLECGGLGHISTLPMSTWRDKYQGWNGLSDLVLTIPDEINLRQCTPMLVIAGTLILPHELTMYHQTVRCSVAGLDITDSLLHGTYQRHELTYGSSVLLPELSSQQYLTETMWQDDTVDAFVVLIHRPDVYVRHYTSHLYALPQLTITAETTPGIIRDRTTRTLVGYMDAQYHSEHLLYLGHRPNIWRLTEKDTDPAIGTTAWACQHTNRPYMLPYQGSDDDMVGTQTDSLLEIFHLIA